MIRYLIFWPLWLLVVIARYPLAVIAVLFFSSADRFRLRPPFRWLETIDNTLIGDLGWRVEHMLGNDPFAWYNRIGWLWRNGGNRFNYEVLGLPAAAIPVWAFESRRRYPLNFPGISGRFLECWFGWALTGPQQGRCKYVFTIRLKTKP